jgi:hypothetical protein
MTDETLNDTTIEPELMAEALDAMAELGGDGLLTADQVVFAAASSYSAFYGHDDDNPIDPEQAHEIVALARRMIALTEVLPRLKLSPSAESFLALAEAACSARMIRADGGVAFQPLDFLAAFERAKARRA